MTGTIKMFFDIILSFIKSVNLQWDRYVRLLHVNELLCI
jgi:hypothetical protein